MAEHTKDSNIGSNQGVNGTLLIDAGSKSPSKQSHVCIIGDVIQLTRWLLCCRQVKKSEESFSLQEICS